MIQMFLKLLNARITELENKIAIEINGENHSKFSSAEEIASRRRCLEYSVRLVEVSFLKSEFLRSPEFQATVSPQLPIQGYQ